jgi:hypothetical protein
MIPLMMASISGAPLINATIPVMKRSMPMAMRKKLTKRILLASA